MSKEMLCHAIMKKELRSEIYFIHSKYPCIHTHTCNFSSATHFIDNGQSLPTLASTGVYKSFPSLCNILIYQAINWTNLSLVYWLWLHTWVWFIDYDYTPESGLLTMTTHLSLVYWLWLQTWVWFIDYDYTPESGLLTMTTHLSLVYWLWLHTWVWFIDYDYTPESGLLIMTTHLSLVYWLWLHTWVWFIDYDHIIPVNSITVTIMVGSWLLQDQKVRQLSPFFSFLVCRMNRNYGVKSLLPIFLEICSLSTT